MCALKWLARLCGRDRGVLVGDGKSVFYSVITSGLDSRYHAVLDRNVLAAFVRNARGGYVAVCGHEITPPTEPAGTPASGIVSSVDLCAACSEGLPPNARQRRASSRCWLPDLARAWIAELEPLDKPD